MQEEVALLYQKITILKFFQDQFKGEIPEELEANTSFLARLMELLITKFQIQLKSMKKYMLTSTITSKKQ